MPAAPPEAAPPLSGQFGGKAGFRSRSGVLDVFWIQVHHVANPPTGQSYQVYLQDEDGLQSRVAGALSLNPDGSAALEWASPDRTTLLQRYTRVMVTLEAAEGRGVPSGAPIMEGAISSDLVNRTMSLLISNRLEPATPGNTAMFPGLASQLGLALDLLQKAADALATGSVQGMQSHLEPAMNVLEGAGGSKGGDLNGDGTVDIPGDQFGAQAYAARIAGLSGSDADQKVLAQIAQIESGILDLLKSPDTVGAATKLADLKGAWEKLVHELVPEARRAAEEKVTFEMKAQF